MQNNLKISQNFISNQELVSKIIKKANLNKTNLILDIGAGEGAISKELIRENYRVLGFELDSNLFQKLDNELKNPNFKILKQDFNTYNLKQIKETFSVFSNIPFNQTTEIVQKILIKEPLAGEVYIIMQEDAANRFLGKKEGLLLSLFILNNYSAEIVFKFKKTDFKPVPKVNIVLTKFIKREKPLVDPNDYFKFLDFISYIIMQQKPSIIDRLSKTLNYYSLKDLLNLLKIEKFNTLYEIPKLKYFEMFDLYLKKYPTKFEIFAGSYHNYLEINKKNKKVFQTRTK